MNVQIECICPKLAEELQHPDGDTVTLRERLDFRSALAVRNDFVLMLSEGGVSMGDALATLTEGYLYHGIESWTLADAKGKPLPVSRASIRDVLFAQPEAAVEVADAADEAYASVILPLVVKAAKSLQPTPTRPSTSAANHSSGRTQAPSSPSSIITTPTGDTETISIQPVGASI